MAKNLIKKVVLITGSREGIGFQTALQMASRNWTVLMADKFDLQEAKNKISKQTLNPDIFTYYLDLGCMRSIRNFAEELQQNHQQLHVLINNAGIFDSCESKTVDGMDPVMQINHFGPFLLTVLLLCLLKKSSPSRIIFVTSSGAFMSNLNGETMPNITKTCDRNSKLDTLLTYYNSKLCNMIISKQFGEKLKPFKVTCNSVHPGMTSSNFLLKNLDFIRTGYYGTLVHSILQFITQSPELSGEMVTFMATSNTINQVTGEYFANYQIKQCPKLVYDDDYCRKVWTQAENMVKLTSEEKTFLDSNNLVLQHG